MTLSPEVARRAFLTLTVTRWLPVGLVVGILTLWQLDNGLSVAQALSMAAFQGWVIVALELPTSSFADIFGRRPVYLAAGVANVAASAALLLADSFWTFAAAAVLFGVFRALDSGPLEAWYVDAVHATEPDADVHGTLAAQGALLGLSIAGGSLVSGGLVLWAPVPGWSALALPVAISAALTVVHLVATTLLMREDRPHDSGSTAVRRAWLSARRTPGVVRAGLALVRHNRVLRGLMAVEVTWSVTMVVFESLQPVRLGELLGSEAEAGAWMGAVAAVGWGVFALGSTLAGLAARRWGVARTAILGRLLNSVGAVVMGLVLGPVALVAAYLFTYGMHGWCGPMHSTLLHREATSANRATVLSLNSMMASGAYAAAAPLLGLLAVVASTQSAMVTGGAIGLLGAFFYRAALRAERTTSGVPEPVADRRLA
ncbi:MAG TPA: MFS transporter [Nocardioides sp.]|nr:MFS transporter [Nocardioides sp.]